METETQPFLYEFRCSLAGCRWRLLIPIGISQVMAARCLRRQGWKVDDESNGYLCAAHGGPPFDA